MKHTIKADGAPFHEDGSPVNDDKSTAGEGVAVCSCGAVSGLYVTRAARKAWHRAHKENAVTEEVDIPTIPTEPTPEVDLKIEAKLHDETEAEVVDEPGSEAGTRIIGDYPEKRLLPAYFFGDIIRKGLKPVLEENTNATVTAHEATLEAEVTGSSEEADDVAVLLDALYSVLPGELASFKKEDPEFLKLKSIEDPKERHKKSWIARRDFCVDFTEGFAEEYFQSAGEGTTAYQLGVRIAADTFEGDDLI